MAETDELKRLEHQLYEYHPELKRDSEDLKLERRNRLFMQLHSSYPEVQLLPLDPVVALTNIKQLLEKCKDAANDHIQTNYPDSELMSPALSLIESSGDEYFGCQRPRRVAARKRRATSSVYSNTDIVESHNNGKQTDAPLSLSILIPKVAKCTDKVDKMEISIDLGCLEASQRLFSKRVDGILRNSTNGSHMLDYATHKERENATNRHLQENIAISTNTIEPSNENNERQEDEMLSRLISQVLVENNESETLQATNVLDNINNNESSNYDVHIPDLIETSKQQTSKKKRTRKEKRFGDKAPPKKRGRKPKNNAKEQYCEEIAEIPKSDLAKYVELFSNTCNMAGSATPAASSSVSQQQVTSTTHYLDSSEQQPITYYLEGDWANGGSCQLVQTENPQIDGGQEEFNMTELVNYIDNVGDAGNVIARVLDGPSTLPVLVQDTQAQNAIIPPPAHVSDILLDLSKKSTINFPTAELREARIESPEIVDDDIKPLDLSIKSNSLVHALNVETPGRLNVSTEAEVFHSNDYASFGAALDMPLIDLDDNINAFMQLTNSQVITSATVAANSVTDCVLAIGANNNNTLPISDFEYHEILAENNVCNNNSELETRSNSKFNDSCENITPTEVNLSACVRNQKVNAVTQRTETNTNTSDAHTENTGIGKRVEVNFSQYSFDEVNSSQESVGVLNLSQENISQERAAGDNQLSNVKSKSFDVGSASREAKIEKQPLRPLPDHINELHSDSRDFLFVDTDALLENKLKSNYDVLASSSNLDINQEDSNKIEDESTINGNENRKIHNETVLSSDADLSKSIDLIEEHQSHNVSVHLPMPELSLVEPNSEEFAFDFETDFESNEEDPEIQQQSDNNNELNGLSTNDKSVKIGNDSGIGNSLVSNSCDKIESVARETITSVECDDFLQSRGSERNGEETKAKPCTHDKNIETDKKQPSALEDSAICCMQEDLNSYNEFEAESPNLNKSDCEENDMCNICPEMCSQTAQVDHMEKVIAPSTHSPHSHQKPDVLKIKERDIVNNLSMLEMESKLDEDCLDFEVELEDDALSLATSCFGSDDERLAEVDRNTPGIPMADQKYNICMEAENSETAGDVGTVKIKIEDSQETTKVLNETFKEFKIPKISLTTATTKHGNGNTKATIATAAALPMVILPTNAFNQQIIKTEPGVSKLVNLEKITRTVQNVCAVTPLTLQQPTFQVTPKPITQTPLDTVTPLFRPMLHLPATNLEDNVNDFKNLNAQQDNCERGEYEGNGGDGVNYGPPTIVVAKTFGITCLPFLVGGCLTQPACKFSHSFCDPATVRAVLVKLSEVDLSISYKFAYNHEIVYRKYVHEFCRVYAERNNRFKLLHMVRDCERYKDGAEVFAIIFQGLQYCGLNKVNACRQILTYSRDRSRSTIDALLAIILEADWTMFADHIEKFSDISTYSFRVNVLHQMASAILKANDQRMTSLFFKCLVNLDPHDVGIVQSSPILMQLLELIKNGQICR
ncbi:uncharacterized protein LOC101452799 isoform X2 [Ceratitis capitata]|uniref:uncharacterized protein LOC101452799 isoform X2 n=1 Tax=Ceratitis capitata TaxID=7213 RepID=UPI00032A1D53|nr:uncharacterized protein LOC101452799 isoform X2 [Ceratitis capitata]